jgi:flagellar biogenesis protein FliO
MRKLSFYLSLLITLSFASLANAEVRIGKIKLKKSRNKATLEINYSGDLIEQPLLDFKRDVVQVTISDGVVWPIITKKVTMDNEFDTKLMAYQFDKKTTRIRAILPYDIKRYSELVKIWSENQKIIVEFPTSHKISLIQGKMNKRKASKKIAAHSLKKKNKKKKKKLDEAYLTDLLSKDDKKLNRKDTVKTVFSSLDKNSKDTKFSIMNYAMKFVAFMGIILLFFYGAVRLLKRGMGAKSKLSFLGSTKQIEVLNTTYVGPKKSLLMIKAHKQIFLVSNTDAGMQLISEIKDPAGLIKEDVKDLSGTNFDTNLGHATDDSGIAEKVKLKTDQNSESVENNVESLTNFLQHKNGNQSKSTRKSKKKESVKFSDQLKEKVKNLKPLQ